MMFSTFAAVAASLIALGGMWLYTVLRIPAWNGPKRGFGDAGLDWQKVKAYSLAGGAFAATTGILLSGQWYIAAILAVFGYFAVLATFTDLSVLKIPFGISVITYLAPLPILVLWWDHVDKFSFTAWFVVVFIMWFVSKVKKGIGGADLRILYFTLTGLSWWVGVMELTYALLLACVIQLAMMISTSKSDKFGVKKTVDEVTFVNKETGRLEGKAREEERKSDTVAPDETDAVAVEPVKSKKPQKKKKHSPFGPALLGAYFIAAMYALVVKDFPDLNFTNMSNSFPSDIAYLVSLFV